MDILQELGVQIILAIQVIMPTLDSFMQFFTFLGQIEFYMLFITFLYWIVDASLGFRVFMVLLITDILGTGFKQLFHQPRPYWVSEVKLLGGEETSYGIPSTHASDSLSVWAYLAYQVRKGWFWVVSIALIMLISFSRLYLGVHFPHDLVAGWLIGFIVLLLFIKYEVKFSGWFTKQSIPNQISLGFWFSIVFIILGLIVRLIITGTSDPESWLQHAVEARSLTHYFTLSGVFFGTASGYVLMQSKVKFQTAGSWIQKVGRYILGIVGVVLALYGLDIIFGMLAVDESLMGYLLRYIRYAVTAFWAMFGAPWLFIKLNLAGENE